MDVGVQPEWVFSRKTLFLEPNLIRVTLPKTQAAQSGLFQGDLPSKDSLTVPLTLHVFRRDAKTRDQ